MSTKVVAALTAPLWIPLVPVAIAFICLWGLVGWAMERPVMLSAASVGVLAALAVVDAAGGGTTYAAITFDCAALAAGAVAVRLACEEGGGAKGGWNATRFPFPRLQLTQLGARMPRAVGWLLVIAPLVYVCVKRGLDASSAAATASQRTTATLVLSAMLPLVQAAASWRWWRHATPAGAAAAEARILSKTMKLPFRQVRKEGEGGGSADDRHSQLCQRHMPHLHPPPPGPQVTVAGMHTVVVGSPGAQAAGSEAPIAARPGAPITALTNPLLKSTALATAATTAPVPASGATTTPVADWEGAAGGKGKGSRSSLSAAAAAAVAEMHADVMDKPAIVFAHGYMSGSAMYMFNLEHFAASGQYRVFSVDWLGCGSSERPQFRCRDTDETETWFLSALEEWRAAMGLSRMILIGHSMGGYLTACYTMRHPHRVQHLVLVSPGGVPQPPAEIPMTASGGVVRNNPSSPTPRPIPRWLWNAVAWAWNSDISPGALLRFFGPFGPFIARGGTRGRISRFVLARPMDTIAADLGEYFYHNIASTGSGEYALRHIFAPGAWGRHPVGPRLVAAANATDPRHRITCPVTFCYGGTHDWMTSKKGADYVAALTAAGVRSTMHLVSPGGHHLYLESPGEWSYRTSRRTTPHASLLLAQPRHADTFHGVVERELAVTVAGSRVDAATRPGAVVVDMAAAGTLDATASAAAESAFADRAQALVTGAESPPPPGSPGVVAGGGVGGGGSLPGSGRATPPSTPKRGDSLREGFISAVATLE